MEITNEQIHEAYNQAKRVYANKISAAKAKDNLVDMTGMSEGSASGYINTFIKVMEGAGYTRTINAYGTDYYLENIKSDYGVSALLTAIASVKKHLEYYEGVGKSSQPKIHAILEKHMNNLDSFSTVEEIHNHFNYQVMLSLNDNPGTRQSRLVAAKKKPREVEVKTKAYIRNPDVVAEVLFRADGECEQCKNPAPFMREKDGSPYLEVHHVIQLSKGGEDSVENALALCPNCHRELHYGKK
jgi:5-methylcytosine-specific restriction protein A